MKMHLFVYAPGKDKPTVVKEYLCDCDKCLRMEFKECIKNHSSCVDENDIENHSNDNVDTNAETKEDAHIDDPKAHIFYFVVVPSFLQLTSCFIYAK